MKKINLIIIATILLTVLIPTTMAADFTLSDGSKMKMVDNKKLDIESKGGVFRISSSVDRHSIGDISKTKEWAYEKSGYEIITSEKKLEIVDDDYVCLEGTKQILLEDINGIKLFTNSNPHCIYYPPQIVPVNDEDFKILRTISKIDDNNVRVDFGDNYDPTYTEYLGSDNNSWLIYGPNYNATITNGILVELKGGSTDKPSLDWTMSPTGGGNGFGSVYANGSWRMDKGITSTICTYYDVHGGWDASLKFVCTNENATNEWNFYNTYINLKSTSKFPHRHYFYMDQMNFSSFAMNEDGFLTPQSMWYDSNTNYGVAAFGYNQSHPQTQSSWNSSYFMALSWKLFDYANGSILSTRDFDYETGTDYSNGGISIGRGVEVSANQTISINIKLIQRDLNQSSIKDQYLVPLMTFNDYPGYGDPEPELNTSWRTWWGNHPYRRNYTIKNTGSETLYGYPQPIRFEVKPEMLIDLVNIIFTDQFGRMLYAELESYNSSEGLAWVRIDVLPKDGTMIYMYWGAVHSENSWYPYVWDDHFIGVWHLNNLNISDSSKYHNNGILRGSPSNTLGVFGIGMSVDSGDGGDGIDVPNFTELNERITAELFFKPESGDGTDFQRYMCKGASYNSNEWCMYTRYNQSDGAIDFRENGGAKYVRKHALNKDNSWHYAGMTFDYRNSDDGGNDVRIMLDGVELTNLSANWSVMDTADTELGLGNQNDQGCDVESDFDEFRVSSIARSVSWRNQTYNSILKYDTVVTEGAIEYVNGTGGVADEIQGRMAVETGVANSELTSPTIESDVVIYVVYQNGTQKMGTFDKFVSDSNKRWAFNYITGLDVFQSLNPLLTILNFWENQSMTVNQIELSVAEFIDSTN